MEVKTRVKRTTEKGECMPTIQSGTRVEEFNYKGGKIAIIQTPMTRFGVLYFPPFSLKENDDSLGAYKINAYSTIDEAKKNGIETADKYLKSIKKKKDMFEAQSSERVVSTEQELSRIELDIREKEEYLTLSRNRLKTEELKREKNVQSAVNARDKFTLSKLYIDAVILPIIDGLKSYKTVGQRSVIRSDHVEVFSYFNIEK